MILLYLYEVKNNSSLYKYLHYYLQRKFLPSKSRGIKVVGDWSSPIVFFRSMLGEIGMNNHNSVTIAARANPAIIKSKNTFRHDF